MFTSNYEPPQDENSRIAEDNAKRDAFQRHFYDKAVLSKIQEYGLRDHTRLESDFNDYLQSAYTQRPFLSPAALYKIEVVAKLFALKFHHQNQINLEINKNDPSIVRRLHHDVEQLDKAISIVLQLYVP